MYTRDDLHEYQTKALAEMAEREEAMIWARMGAGKTALALTHILDAGRPALVVGSKFIIENTWPRELENWAHLQSLSYRAATGAKRKREKAIEAAPQILGINYESLKWLYQVGGTAGREILVMDEITKMKAHNTQRYRSHLKHMLGFDQRFGLTATPAPEGYLGLFGQSNSIIASRPLGRTITEFRHTYTRENFKGNFTEYEITPHAEAAIRRKLAPFVLHVTGDELKRPAPTIIDHFVPWGSTGAFDRYRAMERELVIELREEKRAVLAANQGAAWNKCRQLASGFIYDEDGVGHGMDETKMLAVGEKYEELAGEQVLIFYQYKWEQEWLLKNLPNTTSIKDGIAPWIDGGSQGLVAHPANAAHGLNLQNARHVFWVSLPPGLEGYEQGNGRVDRQGQKKQVVITRFLRENTIDWELRDRLSGKWSKQEDLLKRMEDRIEGGNE